MERVVVWGTGGAAREFLAGLDGRRFRVVAFVETGARPGASFSGCGVLPPEAMPGLEYEHLVIASAYFDQIAATPGQAAPGGGRTWCVKRQAAGIKRQFASPEEVPPGLTEELAATLDQARWFHRLEILPGVFTPGHVPLLPELIDYPGLVEFSGRRVLDIGAWDGVYSFEAWRRGARVTALDIQDPARSGFGIARRFLGADVAHVLGSVEDLSRGTHGEFDMVLFFGVYYHLFNPLRAFFNINSVLPVGGLMLFEGAVLDLAWNFDDAFQDRKALIEACADMPLTLFCKGEYGNNRDWSTWFVPNGRCLRDWLETAGFAVERYGVLEANSRGYGVARKVREVAVEHEVL